MSALADAIRRGRPRTDLGSRSPFAGLRRRHARTIDVVAQSVAATAPAGVLLVQPAAAYARSGSFAFFDIAATITLVVGVALVIGMFARRVASTGSLYTFAVRGLGRHAGLVAGAALGVGYLAVAINTLDSGSDRVARLLSGAPDAPAWLTMVLILGFGGIIAFVVARGLRMSTRLLLVLESIAVLTVLALAVAALAMTKWDLALLVPVSGDFSIEAVVTGVAFALIGFVGFESGAALGPETRRPLAAVPRAILLSVGATGLVMLVGTAAQLSIVADDPSVASLAAVTGLAPLVDAIVAISFLACALAMTNAATRLAFAMSREGVLPAWIGRTSRQGVPAVAGIALTTVVVGVPVAAQLLGGSGQAVRTVTSPASILGFTLAYTLVCAAAPLFLAKIGELTARAVVLCALSFTGLFVVLAFYIASTVRDNPGGLAWAAALIAAIVVGASVLLALRPAVAARVGIHDWPVDGDTIEGSARS